MLRLADNYTRDPKANDLLRHFMNDRLIELIIHDIEWASEKDYLSVSPQDQTFQDNIHFYFPDHLNRQEAAGIFLDLLKALKSKDEWIPNLYEEYALHAVIQSEIHSCEDRGQSTAKSMPDAARKYVKEIFRAEYLEDGEPDEMDPDLRLARFEDLYDYDEYCTFNMDYSMLDHMTEEEIKASHNKKNQ